MTQPTSRRRCCPREKTGGKIVSRLGLNDTRLQLLLCWSSPDSVAPPVGRSLRARKLRAFVSVAAERGVGAGMTDIAAFGAAVGAAVASADDDGMGTALTVSARPNAAAASLKRMDIRTSTQGSVPVVPAGDNLLRVFGL